MALICVGGLATTGLISALSLVGGNLTAWPDLLASSAYVRFLAAKVFLLAIMVALAAMNRLVYLRRDAENRTGGSGLAAGVAWETATGAVILVLAAFLATLEPPLA